jgi:SGNH domain (fused to AT3 domains)
VKIRRRIGSSLFAFAAVAIALLVAGPEPALGAFASSSHSASAAAHPTFPWKGHDSPCRLQLPSSSITSYGEFTTCPPKRVLVIGDSVALTMAIQMSINQEDWGTVIDDGSLIGCGFVTGHSLYYQGALIPMNSHCDDEVAVWTADARRFNPQAVVLEMGWWDSLRHLINGHVESLTEPRYDSMVERQMLYLIHGIRSTSTAPIYFLSVPWMDPPAQRNGQQDPGASMAFHDEINDLIKAAAKSSNDIHFIDVSPYITPAGHYQTDVDGGVCRASSDGVHLYYGPPNTFEYVQTRCGMALQDGILSMIREDLAKK